jgi:hypothetical protein
MEYTTDFIQSADFSVFPIKVATASFLTRNNEKKKKKTLR